jgi:hypothetical protein
MYDDGSHGDTTADDGIYTNEYLIPGPGNYQVKAKATGTAHDGDSFVRHRLRHFRAPFMNRVLYVLDTDQPLADKYKALLEGNGLAVTLVRMPDLGGTDLAPFQLIIIGPDTGLGASWGTAALVGHLKTSGKPVLGLGDGGHAFFGKLGLDIGFNHGAPKNDKDVVVLDASHDIWHIPYDISLITGTPKANVYAPNPSPGVAVNLDQIPAGVETLARRPSESSFYWLAREANRYLMWGFNLGPGAMSINGRQLFVNTAYYAFP